MKNVEMGQVAFWGDRVKRYDCPEYITALLKGLDDRLCAAMWNINQEEYDSPFDNSGNVEGYKNETFEVHAFSWDEDYAQPFNFKCGNFEVSWYKYLGRGMTMNREITPDEMVAVFDRCMESMYDIDKKED